MKMSIITIGSPCKKHRGFRRKYTIAVMFLPLSSFFVRPSLALPIAKSRIVTNGAARMFTSLFPQFGLSSNNCRKVGKYKRWSRGFWNSYERALSSTSKERETELCASRIRNENPFGDNSPFSMGTKIEPSKFWDSIQDEMQLFEDFNQLSDKIMSQSSTTPAPQTRTVSLHVTKLKEELQRFRTQQSQNLNKKAYTIFTDASLEGICESLPTTMEALLEVKGIGPKKVEMFGSRILSIVSSFKEQISESNDSSTSIVENSNNGISISKEPSNDKKTMMKVNKLQLRNELNQYRIQQVKGTNKPLYTIFTNGALEGIYNTLPITEAQLLEVKGIGPKKVEMFGDDILAIVSKYVTPGDKTNEATRDIRRNDNGITPPPISVESLTSEQRRAAELVLGNNRRNVFITGSAGTGKSYLLKYLVQELKKRTNEDGELNTVGIAAPTGVAAIIVGGSTLHSYFGIGLGTGSITSLLKKVNKNSAAIKRISETNVLIIDECSMMSSDLFEKLDAVARDIRRNGNEPLGGMQVICFGDFFQLPPVEKRMNNAAASWMMNDESGNDRHKRSFCFDSHVWSQLNLHQNVVELTNVQRQDNINFISLLNKVRIGSINKNDVQYLNSQCLIAPNKPLPTDGIIPTRLYVLNRDVDSENMSRLQDLPTEEIVIPAIDHWREPLPLSTSPTIKKQMKSSLNMELPDEIRLKIGAQVMLTRNDLDKNLVNGSRGIIERFTTTDDGSFHIPIVRFDNGLVTKIAPVESIRYNPDGVNPGLLVRHQIPLKLAWAITIHKSQGSTLSRAILDMSSGGAFEFGQCYVALSRVKSLDGLWLERPVRGGDILVSPQVVEFVRGYNKK